MLTECEFDFGRIYVLAPSDDHVFLSIDEVEVPVFIDSCHIACVQPSITQGLNGCLGFSPVLAHICWSARDDFTNLSWADRNTILINHTHFGECGWPAN